MPSPTPDPARDHAADVVSTALGDPLQRPVVTSFFDDSGLSERLHLEEFTPSFATVSDDVTGTTTFSGSDVSSENDGETLLEQAEAAGLSPANGCRMGICFTCTSVKKSGCTKNIKTGETDTESDKKIQLCVSVAVGDVDIDI